MKRISAMIILLMLLLSACAAPVQESAPELLEPVQPQMQTATVLRGDLLNATVEYGNIFIASQPVAFPVSGSVETVCVVPGQAVRKGDVLAILNTQSLQKQLDTLLERQASTSYTNALTNRNLEIDIEICQLNLDALTAAHQEQIAALNGYAAELQASLDLMKQTNAASLAVLEQKLQQLSADAEAAAVMQAQIDQQKQAYAQQEAQLQTDLDAAAAQIITVSAEHAVLEQLYALDVEEAELDLKYAKQNQYRASKPVSEKIEQLRELIAQATVTAPMDGIVSWISQSNKVAAEKAFMYISDPTQKALRTTQQKRVDMQSAERIYALIGNQEYELTFREPDAESDFLKSMNGVMLTSVFDFQPDTAIPESANALVFFVHSSRQDVLTLPVNALSRDLNGYFVLRMTNGSQEKVYVKTGLSTEMNVEIVSGLEEGDVVYVAG